MLHEICNMLVVMTRCIGAQQGAVVRSWNALSVALYIQDRMMPLPGMAISVSRAGDYFSKLAVIAFDREDEKSEGRLVQMHFQVWLSISARV